MLQSARVTSSLRVGLTGPQHHPPLPLAQASFCGQTLCPSRPGAPVPSVAPLPSSPHPPFRSLGSLFPPCGLHQTLRLTLQKPRLMLQKPPPYAPEAPPYAPEAPPYAPEAPPYAHSSPRELLWPFEFASQLRRLIALGLFRLSKKSKSSLRTGTTLYSFHILYCTRHGTACVFI